MIKSFISRYGILFLSTILSTYGILELLERVIDISSLIFLIIPITIGIIILAFSAYLNNRSMNISNRNFNLVVKKGDIYNEEFDENKIIIFWGNNCFEKSSTDDINKDSPLHGFYENFKDKAKKIESISKEFNYDVYVKSRKNVEVKYIIFKIKELNLNKEVHFETEFEFISNLSEMIRVAEIEDKGHKIIMPNVGGRVKVNNENLTSERRLDLLISTIIMVMRNQKSEFNIYINMKHKISNYKLPALKDRIKNNI